MGKSRRKFEACPMSMDIAVNEIARSESAAGKKIYFGGMI